MSAILYEGQVTILKRFKGKVFDKIELHNNGTVNLFKNLCWFIWNGQGTESVPNRLDLGYCSENSGMFIPKNFVSILSAPAVPADSQIVPNDTSPYIRRKFLLSQSSLVPYSEDTYSLYLVLRADTAGQEILAYVPIKNSDGESVKTYPIAADESHEIWWKMSFVNVETSLDQAGGN